MGCSTSNPAGLEDIDDLVDRDPPRFKISIVGPSGAGKTSLARRFVHNAYPRDHVVDTQVDVGIKIVDVEGVGMSTVQVWTHPGEADVKIIKGDLAVSDAWMLVVSATKPFIGECINREYKEKLRTQLDETFMASEAGLPLMVVVTHMDVVNAQPHLFVAVQEAVLAWADKHKALAAFVSCSTNDGVLRAFKELVKRAHVVRVAAKRSLDQPQLLSTNS